MITLLLLATLLPDPALTPGHVATTDRATVCERGYSRRVRKVSQATKRAALRAYGIDPDHHGDVEADHLIPISIGGAVDDLRNIWGQRAPGYHWKDALEYRAWLAICRGDVDLRYAQRRMAEDWTALYREVFGKDPSGRGATAARRLWEPAVGGSNPSAPTTTRDNR